MHIGKCTIVCTYILLIFLLVLASHNSMYNEFVLLFKILVSQNNLWKCKSKLEMETTIEV